jgi:hypothetical protein
MTLASFAALLTLVSPHQADLKRVDLAQIALSFDCPKTWEITTNKKSEVHIILPVPDAQTSATLDIYPTNFVSEPEIWQLSQEAFVRQWKEEVLGVPLLLTRVNYTEKGTAKTSATGLLYSDTARKMMYRLVAAPEDFDKADYAWRTALQTFRTFNNRPLTPQDPGKKPDPKAPPVELPATPPKHIIFDSASTGARPIKKADKIFEMVIANRKVQLRYPNDWSFKQDASGIILLSNPGVSSPVSVNVFSTLDSDTPQKALFRASSMTLDQFVKVDRREEPPSSTNLAGGTLWTVWRTGKTTNGVLKSCDACVCLGDFYLVAGYKCADLTRAAAEQKLVEALLDQMSVETSAS